MCSEKKKSIKVNNLVLLAVLLAVQLGVLLAVLLAVLLGVLLVVLLAALLAVLPGVSVNPQIHTTAHQFFVCDCEFLREYENQTGDLYTDVAKQHKMVAIQWN